MAKHKDKYLLVVSFTEGRNFVYRPDTKFIIEAKFDGEQLVTDPVDHVESIEINQELAWELDRKALQNYKLQYGAIKVICYAVTETTKENIGYVVLNIRSVPEAPGKPAWHPLLQPKYPKSKPALQINMYIEEDPQEAESAAAVIGAAGQLDLQALEDAMEEQQQQQHENNRPSSALTRTLSANNSLASDSGIGDGRRLKVTLAADKGYFLVGKASPASQTYVLSITVSFARHLIRLLPVNASSRSFFFTYSFLDNQVTTKPFGDIVSCGMTPENSMIRLHASFDNLKRFFLQQNELTISFCSDDRVLGRAALSWKAMVHKWNEESLFAVDAFVMDFLLKFEPVDASLVRASPSIDATQAPTLGVQIGVARESLSESVLSVANETVTRMVVGGRPRSAASTPNHLVEFVRHEDPAAGGGQHHHHQPQQHRVNFQESQQSREEAHEPAVVYQQQQQPKQVYVAAPAQQMIDQMALVTEEMQIKVAYELQVWKEAREKEFELQLQKKEAKKFQALAEAFKQHDIERELLVQKKIKEYNDLEIVLKNSLNEVEKREKQLALGETQIARMKADLHHEHENKLIELREASKRVQEKADHQVALQKTKIDNLEEEIARYKRQIIEWEKKYADKEAEFARYKERETNRPEIRLQSEISVLNLEKVELERKLETMAKAKEHYKERWTRALQEIALIKKREEENGKQLLKKQQAELEQLKLKFLAAEENESIKSDEKQLISIKHELERLKQNSHRSQSDANDLRSAMSTLSMSDVDPALREHINRLVDERETFLRTGVYSSTDAIVVELDKRIAECLRKAKMQQQQNYYQMSSVVS